jgi:transcriptional regulator with XRE-family HTH domain
MASTFAQDSATVTPQKANIVGSRVREARLRAKPSITQEDLVARLQVHGLTQIDQAKISRIESGARPVYDYEIVPLAKALGVSIGWLLGESS